MPSSGKTSFVLSVNDLEAAFINALLHEQAGRQQSGIGRIVDLKKAWGRTGTIGEVELDGAGMVVLIEVNAPHLEDSLRRQGREVVVIDHHFYQGNHGANLDRLDGLSSLEQVCRFLDSEPGPCDQDSWPPNLPPYLRRPKDWAGRLSYRDFAVLVSANDRGHIPALANAVLKLPGIEAKEANPLKREPREELYSTTLNPLQGPGCDVNEKAPSWDGSSVLTPAWSEVQGLVRDIRLREMTLARWMREGGELDDLNDSATWDREYEITRQCLDEAIAFLRRAQQDCTVRELGSGRNESSDPSLILVQAPEDHRQVMLDALYLWKFQDGHPLTQRLNALFIFHADGEPERLTLLEFSGQSEYLEAVRQWFEPAIRQAWGTSRLELWAGGGEGCYFGAEDRLGTESDPLNKLADRILDVVLTGNRPVERWRTSFLQPLCIEDEHLKARLLDKLKAAARSGATPSTLAAEANQDDACRPTGLAPILVGQAEKHYFWPHLHNVFTPNHRSVNGDDLAQGQSLYNFERRLPGYHLHAVLPNHQEPMVFPLRAVRLHWFYADTLVLEWIISDEATATGDDELPQKEDQNRYQSDPLKTWPPGPPLWRRLLNKQDEAGLTLAQLVDANAKLRMCFSTYNTGGSRGAQAMLRLVRSQGGCHQVRGEGWLLHGGAVNGQRIGGWFRELLALALDEAPENIAPPEGASTDYQPPLELLSDDRCRVISSVVVAGGYPQAPWGRERFDQILARLNTVDEYGQGHFYHPKVAMEELQAGLYERFRNAGSFYACTDHSLVFLGFSDFFPREIIHQRHMATMYRRMFIICMFYQAIAQVLSLDLFYIDRAVGVKEPSLSQIKDYSKLRQRLMHFMNHLFYPEVSSQVQGRELFALMLKQNGGQVKVTEVAEEIHRREEYLADRARDQAMTRQRLLYYLGLPLVAMVGLSQLTGNQMSLRWGIWTWLDGLTWGYHWLGVFILFYLLAGVMAVWFNWRTVCDFPKRAGRWLGKLLNK